MARLVRMDGSGHTTLAEWTAQDDAAFQTAVEEFGGQLELGYIATVPDGPGKASARARAAAGRRPRDHAAPHRRRLRTGSAASPPRAGVGSLAPADRRALAAPLGPRLGRLDGGLHGAVRRRPAWCWSRSSRWPRRWRSRRSPTPGSSPSCTRTAAPSVVRPEGPRGTRAASPRRRGSSATCSATTSGSSSGGLGSRSSRRTSASGSWGRPGALLVTRRARALLLRPHDRSRAAALGPGRPPAARAARGRGGLRDRRQPRLRGRGLAGAPPAAEADAPGARQAARGVASA